VRLKQENSIEIGRITILLTLIGLALNGRRQRKTVKLDAVSLFYQSDPYHALGFLLTPPDTLFWFFQNVMGS